MSLSAVLLAGAAIAQASTPPPDPSRASVAATTQSELSVDPASVVRAPVPGSGPTKRQSPKQLTQGRAVASQQVPSVPTSRAEALRISTPASREFLIGSWTHNGDCTQAATYSPDGQYWLPNGWVGFWRMENDRLTVYGISNEGQIV